MSKISKNPVKLLRYGNHGEAMATALASNLRHSAFADVKIICADGSAWAHRLVLAAVSPVLRHVFFCFNFIIIFIRQIGTRLPSKQLLSSQ